MTDREQELIRKGIKAEERERAELYDNAYRSGLFRNGQDTSNISTEEMRRLYEERLKILFPHIYN